MAQASSPPLRVLAYRALALLAPTVPAQQLAPLVPQLLPALLQHLAQADEDSLHLVLELLHVVIESAAAATGGTGLTPEQALAVAQPVLQVRLHGEGVLASLYKRASQRHLTCIVEKSCRGHCVAPAVCPHFIVSIGIVGLQPDT